uniref:G_PROTEIN_RECEP_F1_2 domain-containing protein n=1 Tax=Heterorhabditis bacteriophora TaxID=37862 RepID=A0A1I7XFN7_HETBA
MFLYISCFLFAFVQAIVHVAKVPSYCDTRDVFGPIYKQFEAACVCVGHLAAVIIYLIVIVTFKRKTLVRLGRCPDLVVLIFALFHLTNPYKKFSIESDARGIEIAEQRRDRIIHTFGMFASLTFIAVVLPYSLVFVSGIVLESSSKYRKYIGKFYMFSTKLAILNPTLNVVLYALRHNDIYMGMKTMLRGQSMPHTTDQWKVNKHDALRKEMSVGRLSFLVTSPRYKYSLAHYQVMKHASEDNRRRERRATVIGQDLIFC